MTIRRWVSKTSRRRLQQLKCNSSPPILRWPLSSTRLDLESGHQLLLMVRKVV